MEAFLHAHQGLPQPGEPNQAEQATKISIDRVAGGEGLQKYLSILCQRYASGLGVKYK